MSNETMFFSQPVDYWTVIRWLDEIETNSTTNSTNSTIDIIPNDGEVLRDTFIVYGSIFVVATLLFCWVRLKFPRPYTVRQWTNKPDLKVCCVVLDCLSVSLRAQVSA